MRIVHLSDWHGRALGGEQGLPDADLYVVTGDMLPNFLTLHFETWPNGMGEMEEVVYYPTNRQLIGEDPGMERPARNAVFLGRTCEPLEEIRCQNKFIDAELEKGGFRRHFKNRDAQVAVVRGNHDFVPLARWFGGDVFEIDSPTDSMPFMGHVIGGTRGINYIYGEWSDEITDIEWRERVKYIPSDVDLLLTHAPPRNILDLSGQHYGSDALAYYVNRRMVESEQDGRPPLRAHFFGHIHENNGSMKIEEVLFSNAATTWITYDI